MPLPNSQLLTFVCVCFLGSHPWYMEVPRLGVQSELQLLANTTAKTIPDPSQLCDLHHSSWQCRILNPLSEAMDQTFNLMVPSQIHFPCATTGTPKNHFLSFFLPFFSLLSRAAPLVYGSSQAWGGIRTRAAGLCYSHSNAGSMIRP